MLPSSKSYRENQLHPPLTLLSRAEGSVKSVSYPPNVAWSSTHDGYRISACDMEILIQQQGLYPVRETASVIFFFFSRGGKVLMPIEGLFLLQFSHHHHSITHNSTKADEMWTLTELDASCQGSCVTIMLLCNQNLLQERCGCLAASLTGLFQAIQIKKGALFLSRMFLFATSSQLYHFLACETINFSFGQNTQYFTYGDW